MTKRQLNDNKTVLHCIVYYKVKNFITKSNFIAAV